MAEGDSSTSKQQVKSWKTIQTQVQSLAKKAQQARIKRDDKKR